MSKVVAFAPMLVALAVYLLLGPVAFARAFGIGVAAIGLYWAWSRNIGVGVEGEAPLFYLRGRTAAVAGLVVVILGCVIFWYARDAVCLFSAGGECSG